MCAIVDKNILGELWDEGGNPAGIGFRKTVEDGKIPLVLGGSKMKQEFRLDRPGKVTRLEVWIQQLQLAGRLRKEPHSAVDAMTQKLELGEGTASQIKSNDHHVIALAVVSGARLLYSNDKDLQKDFGNIQLLGSPKGRVYSTAIGDDFSKQRRNLLARIDLCTRRQSCP